jgi:NADPH:quinone reductase-like Zn-dependent oxidoreductase
MKAVRFDEYGGVDVLKVVDVPRPAPEAGRVLVQVKRRGSTRARPRSARG